MATALPERFTALGVLSRGARRGAEVSQRWGVPTYRSVRDLVASQSLEYVVVCVPPDITPVLVQDLVQAGVAVLAETPPAPDADGLRELWSRVGGSGLVQIAEHSPFMPAHAARQAVLTAGAIGSVSSVQISSTHMYHAVALIRRLLGVQFEPAHLTGRRFTAPLIDMATRQGWTGATDPQRSSTTLGWLDFGEGRSATYDFTDNQWHNPLRGNRLLVRGSHGELLDDMVTRWVGVHTVVQSAITRRQHGIEQDLEGFDLDHLSFEGRVLWRNEHDGARLSDDELAVAALLEATGAWVRGEAPAPYPLAQGCQDHLLALALQEAADTGAPVRTTRQPWAD